MWDKQSINFNQSFTEFTDEKQLSPYGNFAIKITRDQLQGLLDGKMYVFTDEYGFVIGLDEDSTFTPIDDDWADK